MVSLKDAIVILLKNKLQIGMDCDLTCYVSNDDFYYVDYLFSEDTIDSLNLTQEQMTLVKYEEELVEIFETAEEAADFYLKLTNGKLFFQQKPIKRTIKEKVSVFEKDKYF